MNTTKQTTNDPIGSSAKRNQFNSKCIASFAPKSISNSISNIDINSSLNTSIQSSLYNNIYNDNNYNIQSPLPTEYLNDSDNALDNDYDTIISDIDLDFDYKYNDMNIKKSKPDQIQQFPIDYNYNLDYSSKQYLSNISIRNKTYIYVCGLPPSICKYFILRNKKWFGKFGYISEINIRQTSIDLLHKSSSALIKYDNELSALNAINYVNNNQFTFNDNRILKATYGSQRYCKFWLSSNTNCTKSNCGFIHYWCNDDDIIRKNEKKAFIRKAFGINKQKNINYNSHDIVHENLCKLKFDNWLINIVRLGQYIARFAKKEYDDITMIPFLDYDAIYNHLKIDNDIHCKLLLKRINQFKNLVQEFNIILDNNTKLKKYKDIFTANGILTLTDLKHDIITKQDVQKMLNISDDVQIQCILDFIHDNS